MPVTFREVHFLAKSPCMAQPQPVTSQQPRSDSANLQGSVSFPSIGQVPPWHLQALELLCDTSLWFTGAKASAPAR